MGKIRFTLHQRQAVDATGGNLLVSAAAGSGKTAVLTERVVRMLTGADPVLADRLVVVTYTKAAAEEMRRRIADRLAECIAAEPENDFLQSQQQLLPTAKICTIHSLCAGLIRENAQALGLGGEKGGPRIAEPADVAVLKAQSVAEILEEAYTAGDQAFHSLVEFACGRDDKPLFQLILAVYDFIRSFAFPLDFLDRTPALYRGAGAASDSIWGQSVTDYLLTALDACKGLLSAAMRDMRADDAVRSKYQPAFADDLAHIGAIRKLVKSGKMGEAAAAAEFLKQPLGAVRGYDRPDFLELQKKRRKKSYDILGDLKKRFLSGSDEEFREDTAALLPQIETLFALVRRVYARVEEKKREQGVVDYSDLEHYTLSLLARQTPDGIEKTPLAAALADGFDQIMIDECQDINETQNLIFTLLSREETNLFMVGDVKQSIYRFRQAMPALFLEKKKRFPRYDPARHTPRSQGVIPLETNFRSRPEVCGLVNYVFSRLMSEEMGEIDYTAEEELAPGADFPDYPPAAPELHLVEYAKSAEDDKTAAEARYIAWLIRGRMDAGFQVAGPGGLRHARYRDFAILLRSYRDKAPVYARELTAAGVPCFCESSEGYFDSYEVVVVLNLLRVVDNPLRDVPLLSALLSPMFGFSADQITAIRLTRKNVPFYTAMLEAAGRGDAGCAEFLETLRGFRQSAATGRADTLIQEIYDKTDFLSLACVRAGGGNPDANLRLLLACAQRYENLGAGGLSGFLRYLDRVMRSGEDFSAANILSEGADTVRILSIHKSKGLEFPVCILADCAKRFNKMDLNAKYQMNAALGFAMKITDRERMQSYTSLPFEAIRLRTERETIAEEMRTLYVALTRAREKLILVMTMPKPKERLRSLADAAAGKKLSPYWAFRASGMDEWLLAALLPHPGFRGLCRELGISGLPKRAADFPLEVRLALAGELSAKPGPTERVFAAAPDPALVGWLRRAIGFRYPREPLTHVPAKLTVTQIAKQARAERVTLSARPAFLQAQGLTPAQRGVILHSFMQYADFARAAADLAGEIERLVAQKFLTRAEADALNRPKIQAFLRSPLYARMQKADRLLREYQFLYYIKAGEVQRELAPPFADAEILIQGIADCLLFEPEGITIVDYKTDYEDDPDVLARRYYDQLRIYRDAICQAFERPVRQCLLYALHLEREIEIPVPKKGELT